MQKIRHLGTIAQLCQAMCSQLRHVSTIGKKLLNSNIFPTFPHRGKGDPMECGSYRGIKLLEHDMKVVERIFEHRIRQQIEVDDMQFGFMKGKGTTDAIFILL